MLQYLLQLLVLSFMQDHICVGNSQQLHAGQLGFVFAKHFMHLDYSINYFLKKQINRISGDFQRSTE